MNKTIHFYLSQSILFLILFVFVLPNDTDITKSKTNAAAFTPSPLSLLSFKTQTNTKNNDVITLNSSFSPSNEQQDLDPLKFPINKKSLKSKVNNDTHPSATTTMSTVSTSTDQVKASNQEYMNDSVTSNSKPGKVMTTTTQTSYEYKYKNITDEVEAQQNQQQDAASTQSSSSSSSSSSSKTVTTTEAFISERKLLEQSLDYLAFTKGPTHIETMRTLYNLAMYMYHYPSDDNNYQYDEENMIHDQEYAKKFFYICYTQQKTMLGMTHPDTITSMNNLIMIYNDIGQYDKVKEIVYDRIRNFEEDDEDVKVNVLDKMTLESLLKVAFNLHRDNLIDDAIEFYELYLKYYDDDEEGIVEPATTTTTTTTDTFTTNVAKLDDTNYSYQNHYHHQHHDKLSAQHNLAVLYQTQNQYTKAKPLLENCLVQRKMLYGENDPLTLGTLNNLAALFHKIGDYKLSLSLYEYCLVLKKKSLGEEHPDTELTKRNIQRLRKFMESGED